VGLQFRPDKLGELRHELSKEEVGGCVGPLD